MKESSMYEYTNSAKDVRLFLVGEQCSEIIKSFTKFNFEHGVYQFFSEKLLEVAKSQYYIEFTECDIKKFLTEKGVIENVPVFDNVEIEKDDYDKCEKIRVIGYKEYDSSNCVITDYYWFTLWEIAKTYNKKHGCVVIEPPHRDMKCGCGKLKLVLSWCKNANDAITHKLFKQKGCCGYDLKHLVGLIPSIYVAAIAFLVVLAKILNLQLGILYVFVASIIISIIICVFGVCFLVLYISKKETEDNAKNFERHCEHISNTEYSRASGNERTGDISFKTFYVFPHKDN